jgi:glutathione S-transferase
MAPDARERYLRGAPNQERAQYKRDVIERGLESNFVIDAVLSRRKLFSWMETSLAANDHFAGPSFSLADIAVIPYITRLDLLHLAEMWDGRPAVKAWYDRVRQRPSVKRAIADSMSEQDRALFENPPVSPWPVVSGLLERSGSAKPSAGSSDWLV